MIQEAKRPSVHKSIYEQAQDLPLSNEGFSTQD
jgi:hypothetical protein